MPFWVTGSGNTFQGFDVTGVQVGQNTQSDNWKITGNSNTFNQIVTRDDQGCGFYFYDNSSNNLVLNCDSYNLIGVSGVSAGNTDGFGCHSAGSGNVFRYCRAWATSDDGYDSITNPGGPVTYDHCWAYDIGRYDGNSNGFKSGGFGYPPSRTNTSSNIVIGCVAAKCKGNGFYANYQPGQSADWYNNTAYDNGSPTSGKTANINMQESEYSPASKVDGYREVLHDNLAFNDMGIANVIKLNIAASGSNIDDNSFTLPVTVSASDFVSLDASQLALPRKADGSLPDITFMHLVAGSDLIDAGMNVGYSYTGTAPDLGAFENPPIFDWKGGNIAGTTNWDFVANWNPGLGTPYGQRIVLSFGAQAAANNIVDLGSSGKTVGKMVFASSTGTTIQSSDGHSLTLDNDGQISTIEVSGNHEISAPVIMSNNTQISGSGTLTLSGGISGDHNLIVLDNLVASSIAVATLTLSSGATVIIQAIPGGPLGNQLAAVPEPSALALMGIGAVCLLAFNWRRAHVRK